MTDFFCRRCHSSDVIRYGYGRDLGYTCRACGQSKFDWQKRTPDRPGFGTDNDSETSRLELIREKLLEHENKGQGGGKGDASEMLKETGDHSHRGQNGEASALLHAGSSPAPDPLNNPGRARTVTHRGLPSDAKRLRTNGVGAGDMCCMGTTETTPSGTPPKIAQVASNGVQRHNHPWRGHNSQQAQPQADHRRKSQGTFDPSRLASYQPPARQPVFRERMAAPGDISGGMYEDRDIGRNEGHKVANRGPALPVDARGKDTHSAGQAPSKFCERCGKVQVARKFCVDCRKQASADNYREWWLKKKKAASRLCAFCGKVVYHGNAKYCSDCREKGKSKTNRERYRVKREQLLANGKEYVRTHREQRREYAHKWYLKKKAGRAKDLKVGLPPSG